MKKYLVALAILITLSGCGQKTLDKITSSKKEVVINVEKSAENKQSYKAEVGQNLAQAMTEAKIPYQIQDRGGQEVIVEMSGVITTMSRSWNLYINGEPRTFTKVSDITINKGEVISWQYEPITQ